MTAPFRKQRLGAPAGFFATEAAGLRWLTVPGGPRVVRVLAVGDDFLDLEQIPSARPTPEAAFEFGAALARLHDAGAPNWGALPPGAAAGFFGPLDDPLPMAGGNFPDWPTFYAEARLAPILEQGRERGVFNYADARLFAQVSALLPKLIGAASADSPARLHGDLWSGNLLWTESPPTASSCAEPSGEVAGSPDLQLGLENRHRDGRNTTQAVLIDPAAHGGHRECDLAMLALFGAPYLEEIIAGYQSQHPLAEGWQQRIGLHQIYPVAVHAVLFGGGYLPQTRALLHQYCADYQP
jgi:fructosamine-3-kinase